MEYIEKELPRCYKVLFDAVEKALTAMGQQNYGIASSLLANGLLQAESAYITDSLKKDGVEEPPAEAGETPTADGETAPPLLSEA